ncbi:MAG TPA: type II toxin-antitoxin system HicB family antitoxin [Bryobacteraceae bacterium]|nr:type II toxin-antitoxin system HicB family antitoxin [Bryobacteraceae bacterium]
MNYKGYEGVATFDEDAGLFRGEVINTRDVITFQGSSVRELRKAFRDSVDDYLEFCRERGEEPDKPFSGKLVLRISPQLHRQITVEARRAKQSLNSYISGRLQSSRT